LLGQQMYLYCWARGDAAGTIWARTLVGAVR